MSGLTEYEKREFQAGFALLDKDKDGLLTFEDLKEQMTALKFGFSDQQILDLILVATGNKDGKVKYDEFLNRFIHKDQNELEKEINTAFEIIAEDNAKISKHHLRDFFLSMGEKTTDEELDEIMDMAGTGGKLSKDEFIKMLHV
eukprot:CAMPEP_0197027014 /NCGR_PEP_ID=MMETSP1384-20130603/7012_1 /TAXON_ID=29189 /ORGANISM="Ammonia sp." /LENGTH=143 /DNA_ID=CAMNT_0042455803 /DNA_START=101 /DNA_END=532 /DNA_ORIENTATION=-